MTADAPGSAPSAPARLAIVIAYRDGTLPNAWFRAYKRLKRAIRTKGLDAGVELRPTTDLPPTTDVLVVPSGVVVDRLRTAVGHLLATSAEAVQADVDALIATLLADGRLAYAPAPSRRIAVHLGVQPVDARARASGE